MPFAFTAIGTPWQIATPAPLQQVVRSAVLELIEDFDRTWSRFRSDSLVAAAAAAGTGGAFHFPARDRGLLDLYDRLVRATDGAFDPLVGRDLELLGYDPAYRLTPDLAALQTRDRPDRWLDAVDRDGSTVRTRRPVVIDVGAAGKGWLIDLIAALLLQFGQEEFLIDGGGDLRHSGPQPVLAALQHPDHPDRAIGTIPLQDAGLCASSVRRRAWGDGLHHVLNGRCRTPVDSVIACWVLADDCATADGMATALMVAEPEQLHTMPGSWLRMLAGGGLQWSDDFPAELFI